MELANRHRPHRAVIRCKAKMRLLENISDNFNWDEPFDDTLLKELANGLFQSNQYQVFFEKFHSKQEAKDAEDRLAKELAETYQTILERHQDPVVQNLNALLIDRDA
jgi:hypothetical protein